MSEGLPKIITNTAPIIDLLGVKELGGLDLLFQIYPGHEIWTSTYVHEQEILYPDELVGFVDSYIKHKTAEEADLERVMKLFRGKGIDYGELTCAALYFEGGYDELVMANKTAENNFIEEGINVRNVLELAYLALESGIFDEEKARLYLRKISEEYEPTERVLRIFEERNLSCLFQGI